MIEELELSNFRLFNRKVKIRFRPITIFIGKNNSGKSSIIKFLMMLKQSVNVGRPGFLVTSGEEVNLGKKFIKLKNNSSKRQSLEFALKVSEDRSPSYLVWQHLNEKKLYATDKKRFSKYKATVFYNEQNQFLGREHELSFLVEKRKIFEEKEPITPNSSFLRFEEKLAEVSEASEQIDRAIKAASSENLTYDLKELKHLSAMREELKGDIRIDSQPSMKYVGSKGEDTISELWHEEILRDKEKRKFLLTHAKQVLGIEDITFTELETLASCNAVNTKTKQKVNIANFGFGVSQFMPIFVQGLLMPRNTHLIVEQPESHVHPTAQIEMGSFFVDLWRKYKVGSIIETHSDNVLLRIRNHIAKKHISSDDVSVVYFGMKGKTPTVKNLDVHDNGTMIEGLPMEFFGANLKELLNTRVAQDDTDE